MKHFRFMCLAITAIALVACSNRQTPATVQADTPAQTGNVTPAGDSTFVFDTDTYDFGTINQGEKVSYDFAFTNRGKTPLIITEASATCGCTVPDYPHEPVKPGEKGVVTVVFNSAGKEGMQNKVVTISSNANPSTTRLYIVGNIKAQQAYN